MNSKVFQTVRVPSLLLAALLQLMPMLRAALPTMQASSNILVIIFRWGAAAAAAVGSVEAVSGASTMITTTNFTATNGVASTNRLLTAPQVAGWWSASGLPPGINLTGSGSSWRLVGTPTTTGIYTFTLMGWSSSGAPTSERTTNSNCRFTIVAGGGGGGASNSPPVANVQSVTTAEDIAKVITLTGSDVDGNALTFVIVNSPTHGALSGTAPNVTYTPAANYNGADSFTFRVSDGTNNSPAATVSLTVTPVNDAPTASAQSVAAMKNTAQAITLAGSDIEGSALTYAVVASPTKGILSGAASNLTYTPNLNATGADSFTFKVNDGALDSAPATVVINIAAGPNAQPVAAAQSVSATEDTAKPVTLAGSDADGDPLTFAIVAAPAHGALSGTAPNVTYLPATNFNGADSFTFRVNDGQTNSAVATVTISVAAVNDAPVASTQSVATPEDAVKPITLTGSDVDGNALTCTIVAGPMHGSLSGNAPNVTYLPATNYYGADSFTFKVNDGAVDSATATVSITVTAVNDPPIANAQSVTTAEDATKSITLTGSDVDGNALTFAVVASPAHGTLTGTAPNLTYKPATNYNGADSFTFKVNDGIVDSPAATVSIAVTPVNDAPVALAQSVATIKNVATNLTLAGTDADGDALTFSIVTPPAKGTLSGTTPNLTYTPNTNATGADSFTFKVNDGTVDSGAATVAITISAGPNTAPVANAQNVIVNEDGTMLITPTGTDADGNAMTFSVVTPPAHGTLTGTAPNLYYHPAANFNGSDAFSFKANDGIVDSTPATVSITVQSVNDAPVANGQSIATAQNTAKSVTLAGSDVDGDALTFAVSTAPSHGTLSGAAPNLAYTPASGYSGSDTFWFSVNDGIASSPLAAVTITVNAVTNPPGVSTNLPIVTVLAGADAAEPNKAGSFLFHRVGDATRTLTVFFTLEGTAVSGVDFANPGSRITFSAGRTNVTLAIRPVADRLFEGAKSVVLNVASATNYDAGSEDSASILITDDDRPRINITAIHPEPEEDDDSVSRSGRGLRTKVSAAAYTNLSLLLQCSSDLTNWTVIAAPGWQQPVDFTNNSPAATQTCFYRVIYVRGSVTGESVAEALSHQMFSANIVGQVNVLMQPGWNLAANPLNGKTTDGPLGDLANGTEFVPFQTTRVNTWRDGRWTRGVPLTRSTQGGWFYNPSTESVTVTYVGELPIAASKSTLPAGWSVRSSPVTTAVSDDELLGYPLHAGDAVYEFNPAGTGADMWIGHQHGTNGWDVPPTLNAGQGVLIYKTKSTQPNTASPAPPTPSLFRFVPVDN